jgi:hypothetical protein
MLDPLPETVMRTPLRSLLSLAAALAATIGLLGATAGAAGATDRFGDVDPEAFYADPVTWMVDQGITTGIERGCFGPAEPVTRGQVAAFVYRFEQSLGNNPSAGAHPFTDVVFEYQQEPVGWMFSSAITTGTSPSTFDPEAAVTRGDFATLLWRYAGEPSAPAHGFTDVDLDYQEAAVGWMAAEGITTGTTPTTFDPHAPMTRAEAAAFLYRHAGPNDVPAISGTVPCTRTLRSALVAGGLTLDEAVCAAPWLTDFSADYLLRVAHDMEPASFELIVAVATINDEGCVAPNRWAQLSRVYL